jgi:hypothetical protein
MFECFKRARLLQCDLLPFFEENQVLTLSHFWRAYEILQPDLTSTISTVSLSKTEISNNNKHPGT